MEAPPGLVTALEERRRGVRSILSAEAQNLPENGVEQYRAAFRNPRSQSAAPGAQRADRRAQHAAPAAPSAQSAASASTDWPRGGWWEETDY
jgi:hypothetical protein